MLRNLTGLSIALLVSGACPLEAATADSATARQLSVVADEWEPLAPLFEALQTELGARVSRYEQADLPQGLPAARAVFMYVHKELQPRTIEVLTAYARGGGRLIVLHHGLASAKIRSPEWMEFMGVHIAPRDAPEKPWRVIANTPVTLIDLAPGHPVMSAGVRYEDEVEFVEPGTTALAGRFPATHFQKTEVFLNQQILRPGTKTRLFAVRYVDPDTGQPAIQDWGGWLEPVGAGLLFYLQLGHARTDYEQVCYRRILLNCVTMEPEPPRP